MTQLFAVTWAMLIGRGRMLGTAPLGGWKVPYDGPVDTNFTISVDRCTRSLHCGGA